MAIDIRIASADDAATLAEVAASTFPLACPAGTGEAAIAGFIAEELSPARFAGYLADPGRAVLLATEEGKARGYAMLVLDDDPADEDVRTSVTARPTAELSKFYVVAEAHGEGLAAWLMAATLDIARSHGARGLWLGVSQHNPRANRFYERQGFAIVGTKRFMMGPDAAEDDFVRERVL